MSVAPGRRTANSSPPSRAAKAPSGISRSRRSANPWRSESPTWWPRRSLISLNPSRSSSRSAPAPSSGPSVSSSSVRRSENDRRFKSLVNESWFASCARCERVASRLEHEERRDAEQRQQDEAELDGDDEQRRERQERAVGRHAQREALAHGGQEAVAGVQCEHETHEHPVHHEHHRAAGEDADAPRQRDRALVRDRAVDAEHVQHQPAGRERERDVGDVEQDLAERLAAPDVDVGAGDRHDRDRAGRAAEQRAGRTRTRSRV